MIRKSLLLGSLLLLSGCLETVPLQNKVNPEISGCQNCHLSPPPTGEHELHVFKQTHREQITCDECHGTSVRKMEWNMSIKETLRRDFLGWQNLVPQSDSLYIITPKADTLSFRYCLTEVRDGVVYSAVLDSFASVRRVIPVEDSVFAQEELILVFPYESASIRVDTINDPLFGIIYDTVQVNSYGLPTPYSTCEFQVRGDTLFSSSIGPFNNVERALSPSDVVLERPESNRLFVFSQNLTVVDTNVYALISTENSLLSRIVATARAPFTTQVAGGSYVLNGEDAKSYRLAGDSLYQLELDSVMQFGDNVFAELTGHHLNNVVDISFKNFDTTLYREDTVQVFRDSITGEIEFAQVRRTGAWVPEKLTCWSEGIEAFKCHDRVTGMTQWYRPLEKRLENFP